MSVIVTANYKGETFEVEIFRDGSIGFPDRDFQCEKAMAEFSPPGSAAVQLYEAFNKEPAKVLFVHTLLPEDSVMRLAADYTEHVFHMHRRGFPNDPRCMDVIQLARQYAMGDIDRATLRKAEDVAWKAYRAVESILEKELIAAAAHTCQGVGSARWVADDAANVAAYYHFSKTVQPVKWQQCKDAELAWQIRRFVACMEAVGLGKDWPDLGATK